MAFHDRSPVVLFRALSVLQAPRGHAQDDARALGRVIGPRIVLLFQELDVDGVAAAPLEERRAPGG